MTKASKWTKLGVMVAAVAWLTADGARAGMSFGSSTVASGSTGSKLEIKAEPELAISADGYCYLAWQDMRRGVGGDLMANRVDSADVVGQPRRINDDERFEGIADWGWQNSMASIAVSPSTGAVFVAWMDRRGVHGSLCPGQGCVSDIYMTRSNDLGVTWAPNVRLNAEALGNQAEPALAVDDNGRVHAVWNDLRDTDNTQIYHAYSDDGGVSWSTGQNLAKPLSEGPAVEPAIAVQGPTVYVVWADNRNGTEEVPDWDVYATVSSNRGETFTLNVRVNDDDTGRAQRRPTVTIAEDGGAVVAWEDFRGGIDDGDIFLAHNVGGGPTFSANVRVNDDLGIVLQDQPDITLDDQSRPVLVWRDYRHGPYDPDIYSTHALETVSPFTFAPSARVNQDSRLSAQGNPSVGFDPVTGTIVVAFEDGDKNQGGANVSFARGTMN